MPTYARIAIPILVVLLLGLLVWHGAPRFRHQPNRAFGARAKTEPFVAPWVRDFRDSLDASARDAAAGKLAAAEIDADSAESFVTLAAFDHRPAPPDFFRSASAQLDRVLLQQKPGERSLFQHVASARIGLAEYRSSQETPPPPPPPSGGRIMLDSPRRIAANQVLDPAALNGTYLDATLLPELSEILALPPSRAFADKIRVENLTIAGAAQTLDGVHWRNVTFVGTHLRYQEGELSLQNVRFVRCRFGLADDERGNRIANAIALAPPPGAVTIELPAAK